MRHRYTVDDLPAPFATQSANNGPHVVPRPDGATLRVPAGFKIEEYAAGFKNPRYLRTAPNGDIFVTESHANQIQILRDTDGDGKPDLNETFAADGMHDPFGLAFYPPSADPQFLYIANTDGVIRFPYRNGDTKARGPAGAARRASLRRRLAARRRPLDARHRLLARRQKDVHLRRLLLERLR